MDARAEDLRSYGALRIARFSIRPHLSHPKLFFYLTMALILPVCLVGLGRSLTTQPLSFRTVRDDVKFQQEGIADPTTEPNFHPHLIKLRVVLRIYLMLVFAFSLVSTAAILYSVARVYSQKVSTYQKLMSALPRVWKRLVLTFLCGIAFVAVYMVACLMAFGLVGQVIAAVFGSDHLLARAVHWEGLVFFLSNTIYINCAWHLGSAVTTLEDNHGVSAVQRSLTLMRWKRMVAFGLLTLYWLCTFCMSVGLEVRTLQGGNHGMSFGERLVIGVFIFLMVSLVDVVGFVMRIVLHLACKAYHFEAKDGLQFMEQQGASNGGYAPIGG